MEPPVTVLWQAGAFDCVVIHHWEAQSYEIQVRERERVFVRRVFATIEDAARYASERAYECGAVLEN